jgi:hypothetical protein
VSCSVWAEKVERNNGLAIRVEMTNGNVIIPFEKRNGKVVALYNEKRPAEGLRTLREDLVFPPAHLKKSFSIAAAILRGKRKKP